MGEEKSKSAAGSPVSVWPAVKPFVNGGAAGMLATCVVQPIDTIKVTTPTYYYSLSLSLQHCR